MLLQRTGGAGLYLPVEGITLVQAGADGVRTFSFVGSCSSTSSSLDFSSLSAGAVAAGDLLVYVDGATHNSAVGPTAVTPSGFTNHISTLNAGTTTRGMVSSKKAAGSEGAITGMNDDNNNKVGLVFRPSTSFTTITASGISSECTSANPTLQTCNPSAETSAVVLLAIAYADASTAAFSTHSPTEDGSVTNPDSDLLVGYNIFNTSPQSTQIDMNDLGTNWLASLYYTVS